MDMKESAATLFEASPELIYQYQSRASRLVYNMRAIPQPIIAAVHGAAAGAGFSFALASDVRVITPEAKFNGLTGRGIVENILEQTPVPV